MSDPGTKPRFKFQTKNKESGNKFNIAAFWERSNGMISGALDREVESIRMKDGTVIKPEEVYANLWDNGPADSATVENSAIVENSRTRENPKSPRTALGVPINDVPAPDTPF